MLITAAEDQENFFSGSDAEWNTEVNTASLRRYGGLPQPDDLDTGDWVQYRGCGDISILTTKQPRGDGDQGFV